MEGLLLIKVKKMVEDYSEAISVADLKQAPDSSSAQCAYLDREVRTSQIMIAQNSLDLDLIKRKLEILDKKMADERKSSTAIDLSPILDFKKLVEEKIAEKDSQIEHLTSALEGLRIIHDDSQKKIAEKDSQIEDLTSALQELRISHANSQKKIAEKDSQIEDFISALQGHRISDANSQKKIAEKDSQIKDLTSTLQGLHISHANLQKKFDDVKEIIQGLNNPESAKKPQISIRKHG